MENNIQVFNNEEFGEVRTVMVSGEPWFVAVDVCKALELSNPTVAVSRLDEDERAKFNLGRQGEGTIVNEAGLYSLILGSRKPEAKVFKRWITHDVIPAIRKTAQRLESIEYSGRIDGLVYTRDGVPTTTSVLIADKFDRQHKVVLRMIDAKVSSEDKSVAQFCATHIHESQYVAGDGQVYRQYELDKQGFSFIALGMTGVQADLFKIEYINAFTKMEEAIADMYKARVIEDVLPQNNSNRQFVYVIKNPLNETVKIGVAHDVEKRISQLQTGAGVELELIYQSMVCSNAFSIERDVHAHFEQYRTFGEWFKVSPTEVIDYLENQRYVLKSEYAKYLSISANIHKEAC
nr:MAG TPA: repressor domain protein [Caudoviricetes sp.]